MSASCPRFVCASNHGCYEQLSQRVCFHIQKFHTELLIDSGDTLSHLQGPTFPFVRFARERLWLVPHSEIHQVHSGVWGTKSNWCPCRSVSIDCRLLVYQLVLLIFDDKALFTQLRLKVLQPLRELLHCGFDHCSATLRERVTERDFLEQDKTTTPVESRYSHAKHTKSLYPVLVEKNKHKKRERHSAVPLLTQNCTDAMVPLVPWPALGHQRLHASRWVPRTTQKSSSKKQLRIAYRTSSAH